jgi:hypothetical protein
MSIEQMSNVIGIFEAARICGLSVGRFRYLADAGRVPMVRDALGRRFFDRATVLKFARTRKRRTRKQPAARPVVEAQASH